MSGRPPALLWCLSASPQVLSWRSDRSTRLDHTFAPRSCSREPDEERIKPRASEDFLANGAFSDITSVPRAKSRATVPRQPYGVEWQSGRPVWYRRELSYKETVCGSEIRSPVSFPHLHQNIFTSQPWLLVRYPAQPDMLAALSSLALLAGAVLGSPINLVDISPRSLDHYNPNVTIHESCNSTQRRMLEKALAWVFPTRVDCT